MCVEWEGVGLTDAESALNLVHDTQAVNVALLLQWLKCDTQRLPCMMPPPSAEPYPAGEDMKADRQTT